MVAYKVHDREHSSRIFVLKPKMILCIVPENV